MKYIKMNNLVKVFQIGPRSTQHYFFVSYEETLS